MAASRSSTRMMAKGKKAAAAGTQRMGGAGYKCASLPRTP